MAPVLQSKGVCIEMIAGEVLDILIPGRPVDSGKICITLIEKSGQRARLRIKADESVTIDRRPAAKQRSVPA